MMRIETIDFAKLRKYLPANTLSPEAQRSYQRERLWLLASRTALALGSTLVVICAYALVHLYG